MVFSKNNRVCQLFGIKKPIIQAGMVWVSGHKLAVAAAEEGALGVLGAGSMTLDVLKLQLKKALSKTNKPLALNVPLLSGAEKQLELAFRAWHKKFYHLSWKSKKIY